MKLPLSVLLLEDSEDDAQLLLREFERSKYDVTVKRVDNANDMAAALAERAWDIIISDYSMPSFNALSALDLLRKKSIEIPVIVISGTVGEDTAVEVMKAGADDFFIKGKTKLLMPAIEREINTAREQQKRRQVESQLYQAEERFVKAFHASPIATCISTLHDDRFVDVNERFSDLTGYARDELIGRTGEEVGLWQDSDTSPIQLMQTVSPVRDVEYECRTKSGQIRFVLVSLEQLHIGDNTYILSMLQDITERRVTEAFTFNLNRQLEQRNSELIAIQEIGRILASTLDIQEVYQAMYREVAQKILHVPHFTAALYDEKEQMIHCGYAVVDGEERNINEFPPVPLGSGPTSQTILTQEPRVVDLQEALAAKGTGSRLMLIGDNDLTPKSALYVPLITGGKVLGVLNFQDYAADAFQATDVMFIATIASQAAIALKNAQLYVTVRDNAAELNSLYNATSYLFKADSLLNLGYQVVQAVVREFGQADCGLVLIDKQEKTITRVARSGSNQIEPKSQLYLDGPGLIPEALRTGKFIYVPDVSLDSRYTDNSPATKSELVVPLHSSSGVIGALDLQSLKLDAFTQRDIRVLTAFAERVAAAIENMRLYDELNRYAAELEWRVDKRTSELHRAKERVEAILNNSSDAIILTDDHLTIHQANPAFHQLFGQSFDEIFGHSLSILFEPDQFRLLNEVTKRILQTHQSERIELVGRRKDGTSFNADIAIASTVQDTEEARLIYSMRDITVRKQMEENLRLALEQEKELSELKSRFVAMASHEFRTPLATIQSSSDLLMHYETRMAQEQKHEHLGKIQTQVKHLTGLLDDILTLNRAESVGLAFNPILADVESLTREIIAEIQTIAPGYTIHFSSLEKHEPSLVDVKLMQQAITNLLSNAVKYSPTGSTVHVSLSYNGTHHQVLQVRDEGIGIPPEDRKHLFDSFHRAKNVGSIPGTGLGLAIVKQAVEAHGGSVTFESEVGRGTTFTIVIPTNTSR